MKIDSKNTNFNLRHLRAIHAIRAEGSFARAADRLGVVPSALTETVRQLEDIAGGALFDRRSRPPAPTPLGQEFLEETAPLLAAMDRALSRLRDRARGLRGRLRIGATPSAITPHVAPAIAAFRQSHPDVDLTLHDDVAEALAGMVADDRLDLAIAGRARSSPELVQTEIAADLFGLACATGHPLARTGAAVPLDAIDPQELIHLGADTGTSRLLAGAALPARFKTGPLRSHSTIAQLCLVRAGVGIALLPRNAVELFNDPGIAFVPLADLRLERKLYLLTPARRAPSPTAAAFEAQFRDLSAKTAESRAER